MEKFILLKRTHPKSKFDRECDGYKHIIKNSTENERIELGIVNLCNIIHKDERYIYQVGKENGKFKTMSISFENFEIIRKHFV